MRLTPPRLVLALAALLALPAAAAGPEAKATPEKPAAAAAPAMKAYVDPVTGAFLPGPPPAEKAILASAPVAQRPALEVRVVRAKAGGKMVKLDDRFMMEMTETVGPDGKVGTTCVAEQDKAPAKEARRER